jgi:hypothetical protein
MASANPAKLMDLNDLGEIIKEQRDLILFTIEDGEWLFKKR